MVPSRIFVDFLFRLTNINSNRLSELRTEYVYEYNRWQDKRQSLLCLIDAAQQVSFDGAGIGFILSLKAIETFCDPHSVSALLH